MQTPSIERNPIGIEISQVGIIKTECEKEVNKEMYTRSKTCNGGYPYMERMPEFTQIQPYQTFFSTCIGPPYARGRFRNGSASFFVTPI